MADILITDLTEGTLDGNGVFDKLMAAATVHITSEFKKNRITGDEYATVYLGGMQAAMAQAVQFVLGEQSADKQADLLNQKIETEKAQTVDDILSGPVAGLLGKQVGLLQAQTDGFARDAEQKILKIMMDNYAIRRTTNSVEPTPDFADNTSIDVVIAKAALGIGIDEVALEARDPP